MHNNDLSPLPRSNRGNVRIPDRQLFTLSLAGYHKLLLIELGGSAWEAAVTSFFLFFAGAIAPVTPFLFLSGAPAVITSLAASGAALFATGAAITLLTGRGVLYSGTRQLLIGMGAAGVTFGSGRLIGISVG